MKGGATLFFCLTRVFVFGFHHRANTTDKRTGVELKRITTGGGFQDYQTSRQFSHAG